MPDKKAGGVHFITAVDRFETSTEHKTVQARMLEYAEAIGWTFVSRE